MPTLPRWLVLMPWLMAGEGAGSNPSTTSDAATATVRVLLVRHGEAEAAGADPPLASAGRARADCLVERLRDEPLTHLFSSSRRRAAQTLAPLAASRQLAVAERDPMDVGALATELAALPPGSVAVVVGHTNTLPLLVNALGGELSGLVEEQGQLAIPRDEHDRLVSVRLRAGGGLDALEERRYSCGEPRR